MARLREKPIVRCLAADLDISDATLHGWLKQADIDEGRREGLTSDERAELVRLRRARSSTRRSRRGSGRFTLRRAEPTACRAFMPSCGSGAVCGQLVEMTSDYLIKFHIGVR